MLMQNEIKLLKDELKYAVMVYKNNTLLYPVVEGKIGAAQRPTKKFHKLLLSMYNPGDQYKFEGYIPDNVMSFKSDTLDVMWYTKKDWYPFKFSESLELFESRVRRLNFWVVFHLVGNTLTTYVTKSRPAKGVRLYRAPFLNVSDGSVCLGSAWKAIKETTYYEKIIDQTQRAFFESTYTHTSGPKLINGDIVEYYQNRELTTDPLIYLKKRL